MKWQQWVLIASPVFALMIQPVGWIPELRAALKARKKVERPRSVTVTVQIVRCLWWIATIALIASL